ncbi:MAG: transporter substrate-binding domain-containing protein [Gammaproteobacteria bacterium]|nr:transporter substrate-binding domain-containing protein [Gammaproteobacteria bacterium]
MKSLLISIHILLSLMIAPQLANAVESADILTVATRHVPPFAIKQDDGTWQGISIELWQQVADGLGLEYQFREMGLKEMLEAVEQRQVDAAVAALTITSEREKRMDFSHPFLSSGLGIAVPLNAGGGWLAVTQRFFSTRFLQVVTALLGILLLIGILVWLFERRQNTQFGGSPAQGIGSGLWWSAVTMTTVGYGDKAPQTLGGRFVALVWMFASIIIISSFTAAIATALTIGELGGKVQSKDDLARARIVSITDSTSAQYLQQAKLNFRSQPDLTGALESLSNGAIDALVYDAPILRYQVRQAHDDRLSVLPGSFARQDYGIALPSASPYREAINQAILERLYDPAWEEILFNYLGDRD